jgi:hypothetical protein
MRRGAMVAHQWIATLFVLGVAVQFFLAGLGLFEGRTSNLGGSSKIVETSTMDPHRALGSLLVPVALVVFLVALAAGYRGRDLALSGILFVLVFVQTFLASLGADTGAVFGGLHALNALAIAFLGGRVMERSRKAVKAARRPAVPTAG